MEGLGASLSLSLENLTKGCLRSGVGKHGICWVYGAGSLRSCCARLNRGGGRGGGVRGEGQVEAEAL